MFLHLNLKKKKKQKKTHTTMCHWCRIHSIGTKIRKFFSGYSQASGSKDRKYGTHVLLLLFLFLWQASLINHDMHTKLSHKSQILSTQCSKQVTPISQI